MQLLLACWWRRQQSNVHHVAAQCCWRCCAACCWAVQQVLPAQRCVPVVFHCVLGAALEQLSNVGPAVAVPAGQAAPHIKRQCQFVGAGQICIALKGAAAKLVAMSHTQFCWLPGCWLSLLRCYCSTLPPWHAHVAPAAARAAHVRCAATS